MKVIDLFNHCKITVKLLTKLGAVPSNWCRFHEIYRDYIKYGVSKTSQIHSIQTRECYRARDTMESYISVNPEEKKQLIEELKLIIQLLTNQN